VVNNIIQVNIAGLSLANNPSGSPALVRHNLFRNNNQPGPVSGTAIYTDQFNAGGNLANVTIDANAFANDNNAAIILGSTQAGTQSNVTVTNNAMTNEGNGVLAFNLASSSVVGKHGHRLARLAGRRRRRRERPAGDPERHPEWFDPGGPRRRFRGRLRQRERAHFRQQHLGQPDRGVGGRRRGVRRHARRPRELLGFGPRARPTPPTRSAPGRPSSTPTTT